VTIEKIIKDIKGVLSIYKSVLPAGMLKKLPYSYQTVTSNDTFAKLKAREYNIALNELPSFCKVSSKKNMLEHKTIVANLYYAQEMFLDELKSTDNNITGAPIFMTTESSLIDTRRIGQGVNFNYIKENLHKNLNLNSLTDVGYYDGQPTNSSTVIFVSIPEECKTKFDEDFILSKVKKYAALGTQHYVEYE